MVLVAPQGQVAQVVRVVPVAQVVGVVEVVVPGGRPPVRKKTRPLSRRPEQPEGMGGTRRPGLEVVPVARVVRVVGLMLRVALQLVLPAAVQERQDQQGLMGILVRLDQQVRKDRR